MHHDPLPSDSTDRGTAEPRHEPRSEAPEAARRFARAFVHEVRSPLNALAINLDLVQARTETGLREEDKGLVQKAVGRASAQVRRVDDLLKVFLELWAAENKAECDAAALVGAAARLATHEANRHGGSLQTDLCSTARVRVSGRVLVEAVFLLLFESLVEDATVRVSLTRGEEVRLSVEVSAAELPSFAQAAHAFARLGGRVIDRPGSFMVALPVEA